MYIGWVAWRTFRHHLGRYRERLVRWGREDAEKNKADDEQKKKEATFTEEVETIGSELVDTVKKLVSEGNVRSLIIRKEDGKKLLEIPLTAGVAVGGAAVIFAPVLAALGAMAALVSNVKIEVIREGQQD